MTLKWPVVDVKGRHKKNVHNCSSFCESESPENKKHKGAKDKHNNAENDEENQRKVADFVQKREARKTKFSQSKIKFISK